MTKLGTALENILLDRTGRTGLHEVLAKFALPVKDIDTSIVTTMFTTLLAQGGLSSADSSGIGYASKPVTLASGDKAYMSLKVSRKRTQRSIVPKVDVSFASTYRGNAPESDESYKGTLLTSGCLEGL